MNTTLRRSAVVLAAATLTVAAAAPAGASTSPGSSGAPGPAAPNGSAESLLAIPDNIAPGENKLVTQGFNGPCYSFVTAQVQEEIYPDSAGVSPWTVDSIGLGDCPASAELSWENLDNGNTGAFEITQYGPGHPKDAIMPTGPGEVVFTLTPAFAGETVSTTVNVPEYDG